MAEAAAKESGGKLSEVELKRIAKAAVNGEKVALSAEGKLAYVAVKKRGGGKGDAPAL